MTTRFDDEILMAFADGELDPQQAAEIAAAVEADADIARRVAYFRATRRMAKEAYAAELDEPVPAALRDTVAKAAATSSHEEGARVIPLRRKDKGGNSQRVGRSLPIAASIAAVVGALAGYWFASNGPADRGPQHLALGPVGEPGIAEALTKTPSGDEFAVEQTGRIQMIASFRDGSGVLCREFEIMPQGAVPAVGIACRTDTAWQITFAQSLKEDSGGGYTPAAAAPVVDAYLETLSAGPPLSVEEERAALGSLGE